MKYNIGDEVTIEMMGKITKIELSIDDKLYYMIENKGEFCRVLESKVYPLILPPGEKIE